MRYDSTSSYHVLLSFVTKYLLLLSKTKREMILDIVSNNVKMTCLPSEDSL